MGGDSGCIFVWGMRLEIRTGWIREFFERRAVGFDEVAGVLLHDGGR